MSSMDLEGYDENTPVPRDLISTCIGCGCDDEHACMDKSSDNPCYWLKVDRNELKGLCSCCPEHLERWNSGDRKVPKKTKLTQQDIINVIMDEDYYRFPDTTVTVCCLTLENGYHVIGKSAALDVSNFDQEIGEKVAREDAVRQIWELEGYLLKQYLIQL